MEIIIAVLILLSGYLFLRWQWSGRKHEGLLRRLPPGSMGWPYVGETLKFYTQHPNTFFSKRRKRYGDIFKSNILGCPCVMVSSPEAIKVVLVSQAHLFKPTYPPSKERMIGPNAVFFHQGDYHSMLKKLILTSFLPAAIKGSVQQIENEALKLLHAWEMAANPLHALEGMSQYAFDVAMLSVFGDKQEVEIEGIKYLYQILEKGYNSMPLDFPGTPFHKAMKARKKLNKTMMKLIEKRRSSGEYGGGLVGVMLRAQRENVRNLSDDQIADNIIGVIFAAHDTTASVLTWLLKYLHDNADVLDCVTKEQEELQRKLRLQGLRRLTWDDTRQMSYTTRVIQETLRSASILSFTFREAVEDVEFQGFVIPKGWKVLPLFRTMHHSPDFFPQPQKFDPSRFTVSPRPNTYMPFGHGVHSCPGSELAKLEMLILLHHLTTNYRWKVFGEEDAIQYGPFPVPKGGLPIHFYRRVNVYE
ncbi:abscisic acid 8'-hydroxylase 2 [Dorcoceras hygrometricum]|uniref:(+)-abscisic acid 8'-hydroxylase n=1 Tax=Dorcoceras hygrometricum TaxID=472368 RepID=A0A2Z7BTN7_9LAMI|nr:abscisic acid 8'-hydroxylase 2 [Dorcoceras hygrometricum]